MKNKSVYIPSFLTLLNFFFGFLSVLQAMKGTLHTAAWFIILAVLCDSMDGKVARFTRSESCFGFELDSLADVISFGIAPVVLVYTFSLYKLGYLGIGIGFFYIVAGAYRLARFNVINIGNRNEGYIGLPIPVAGTAIAALWIFNHAEYFLRNPVFCSIFLSLLSVLMISTIPYDWPKICMQKNIKQKIQIAGLILITMLMALLPGHSIFPFLLGYIFWGVIHWIIDLIKGRVMFNQFFLIVDKSNGAL